MLPLMEDDPPSVLPRGAAIVRPPVHSDASASYIQLYFGLFSSFIQPTGMWIIGCQSLGPASSTQIVVEGSSARREAMTQPADPAPTMM